MQQFLAPAYIGGTKLEIPHLRRPAAVAGMVRA
jgi:hypothetical protein